MEEMCQNHLKGCPLYKKHIAVGDPAQGVLKLTYKEKIDMVFMTSHGKRAHFRFGGVAQGNSTQPAPRT